MKFTADSASGNVIRSYSQGEIKIGTDIIHNNVIVSQNQIIHDWDPPAISQLSIADFEPALELKPEIILFGTGARQQFPDIALLTEIMRSGTAIEVMQTSAACRTFNVLIGEFRAVVAVLLIE
jgi:uncharacterized protein